MSKKFLLSKTPTPKPRLSDEMKKDVIYKVCVASLAFLGAFLTFNAVVSITYVLYFFYVEEFTRTSLYIKFDILQPYLLSVSLFTHLLIHTLNLKLLRTHLYVTQIESKEEIGGGEKEEEEAKDSFENSRD